MQGKIAIIDYGVGNLHSVYNAVQKVGGCPRIISVDSELGDVSHIILPGVGAFKKAIATLQGTSLMSEIEKAVLSGVPTLGICLGMQLLLDESLEFGKTCGLSFIPGKVIPLPSLGVNQKKLKIPNIGWNKLLKNDGGCGGPNNLLSGTSDESSFYFLHSFMVSPKEKNHILANYTCGGELVPAIINCGNIWGTQFHPEKSGPSGLQVLQNFTRFEARL